MSLDYWGAGLAPHVRITYELIERVDVVSKTQQFIYYFSALHFRRTKWKTSGHMSVRLETFYHNCTRYTLDSKKIDLCHQKVIPRADLIRIILDTRPVDRARMEVNSNIKDVTRST